jgi:hypothetical protein
MYVPCILYMAFYFNQQCTMYIFYFNNTYIVSTPKCFDTHHPSTQTTSAQAYPNDIRLRKHATDTNCIVKIM